MRRPEHDTLLGIALLLIGIVLLVFARMAWGKAPELTPAQKQIMVEAYQAGYHVGLPLAFTAVVYVESDFRCRTGDHGLARGCAQIHAVAVRAATGMDIPVWQYDLPPLEDVDLAIGAQYFAQCIQRWGWPAGIGAYNQGETNSLRLGRKRLANLPYTRAVLAAMVWLREVPEDIE